MLELRQGNLGDVVPVGQDDRGVDPQLGGDLLDGSLRVGSFDLEIRGHAVGASCLEGRSLCTSGVGPAIILAGQT